VADGVWIPAAGVLAATGVALALFFWWKGQPFADGEVFSASRGGATPVTCHGHRQADAVRMKQLIEQHQTHYYRAPGDGRRSRAEALGDGGQPEVARG
jgi:hypothetical protein